jgi:hypothetical protein
VLPALCSLRLVSRGAWFDLTVAISAVHWSAVSRFKGQFCCLTTLGAHRREHLSPGLTVTGRAVTVTLGFSGRAAQLAALGIIGIAFFGEEFLLADTEGKIRPAVGALEGFVHKAHEMTSFLEILG